MAQLSDFAAKAAEAEAEIDRIKAKLADGGMSAADEAAALEAVGKVVDDLKAV